jgi:hypothetical protein
MDSILTSVKLMLGITEENTDFDTQLILHINTVFMNLNQLGVGPENGFRIEDNMTDWEEYITEEDNIDAVKSYVYLKTKLLFDPPLSATVMEATKQMIHELEWRLNVQAETK